MTVHPISEGIEAQVEINGQSETGRKGTRQTGLSVLRLSPSFVQPAAAHNLCQTPGVSVGFLIYGSRSYSRTSGHHVGGGCSRFKWQGTLHARAVPGTQPHCGPHTITSRV